MSSFDAAMAKVDAMVSNAQEALRDLPEVSGMLDATHLTDGQRQAIRRRLEPIKQVRLLLEQAEMIEGGGGPDWEQPPNRDQRAGGVGSEGGGGSQW